MKKVKYTRRRTIVIVAAALFVLVAGIAALWYHRHNTLPAGTTAYTITVGGMQRTYRVYRPPSLPAGSKVPLVVMLHGALGTGKQAEADYGWDAKAASQHFIVAYPDGFKRTWDASSGCCGPAVTNHVDDVSFITRMVQAISSSLPVDPNRIYATGISNGGAMTYRLACSTTIFAAIGPDSTNMLNPCPSPAPISVIHIHGAADQTFPYDGGPGKHSNNGTGKNPANTSGPPIPDLIATWRKTDNCDAPTTTTSGAVTTSIATCASGRGVELITIAGAGHQWPGGAQQKPLSKFLLKLDPPSTALNATDTIWQFFAAHPKA